MSIDLHVHVCQNKSSTDYCRYSMLHIYMYIFVYRIAGLEPIVDVVVEFDGVGKPLGDWCAQQQEYFESLPLLEVTPEQLLDQQKTFEAVVADIVAHGEQVERTEEVALKFVREAEVCVYIPYACLIQRS